MSAVWGEWVECKGSGAKVWKRKWDWCRRSRVEEAGHGNRDLEYKEGLVCRGSSRGEKIKLQRHSSQSSNGCKSADGVWRKRGRWWVCLIDKQQSRRSKLQAVFWRVGREAKWNFDAADTIDIILPVVMFWFVSILSAEKDLFDGLCTSNVASLISSDSFPKELIISSHMALKRVPIRMITLKCKKNDQNLHLQTSSDRT